MTLLDQLHRKAAAWSAGIAQEWETQLKQTGPSNTGRLNQATRSEHTARTATVTVNTEYAHIVAYGAAPHVIEARPGGMLAFPGQTGETIYRRSVNHPGVQPNPWWADAIDDVPRMSQRVWTALG